MHRLVYLARRISKRQLELQTLSTLLWLEFAAFLQKPTLGNVQGILLVFFSSDTSIKTSSLMKHFTNKLSHGSARSTLISPHEILRTTEKPIRRIFPSRLCNSCRKGLLTAFMRSVGGYCIKGISVDVTESFISPGFLIERNINALRSEDASDLTAAIF